MTGVGRAGVTLVTGGARSGKSALALRLASVHPRPAFVATAEARRDPEMAERIRRHRRERGDSFVTVEEPLDVAGALRDLPEDCAAAVVDCLTLWISNLMLRAAQSRDEAETPPTELAAYPEIEALLELLASPRRPLVLVTNEVGWGVVPATPLGRAFRDLAGRVNQEAAALAGRVVMVVSGVPWVLRGEPLDD